MSIAGWAEILIITLLAFVIIGPKDLPKILLTLGRFMQVLRHLSNEFMAEFEAIHHVREMEEQKKTRNEKDNT